MQIVFKRNRRKRKGHWKGKKEVETKAKGKNEKREWWKAFRSMTVFKPPKESKLFKTFLHIIDQMQPVHIKSTKRKWENINVHLPTRARIQLPHRLSLCIVVRNICSDEEKGYLWVPLSNKCMRRRYQLLPGHSHTPGSPHLFIIYGRSCLWTSMAQKCFCVSSLINCACIYSLFLRWLELTETSCIALWN